VAALTTWNALPTQAAERELLSCCASPVWARTVAAGRPYRDLHSVFAASAEALSALPWSEVELALSAHPRIGDRLDGGQPGGDRLGGEHLGGERDPTWSRQEQAGAQHTDAATTAALAAANQAYEERFGHVFLIFATGRTAAEMLIAARTRLANDPVTEQAVVRAELGKIARQRLERLLTA
jgi:2-oxo-4-hydroxy-4-carboxy-5-ureidoimidazoline decarboxylase